jgi:hypothetical protein
MIYADLPAGATAFVDAGVFIHHFEPNARYGPAATDLGPQRARRRWCSARAESPWEVK